VNNKGVQKIVQLAQKEKAELEWLTNILKLDGKRGKTDAKTLIKMIVYNINYESDDDDADLEDEEDLDEMDSGSDASSKYGNDEDGEDSDNEEAPLNVGQSDIEDFLNANKATHADWSSQML